MGSEGDVATTDDVIPNEPMSLSSSDWTVESQQSASKSLLVPSIRSFYGVNDPMPDVYSTQNIVVNGVRPSKHYQVFINVDNDASTGFQFKDEAWSSLSGADYVIEDNYVYKSTANDSSWSWEYVPTEYFSGKIPKSGKHPGRFRNPTKVHVFIGGSIIDKLCKDFTVGYVGRDENWNIENFYPASNKMLKQKTSFCGKPNVNTPPTLTRKGTSPMQLTTGTPFVEPGVIATDSEDGDITHLVKTEIVVLAGTKSHPVKKINHNSPGTYIIHYDVTDSGGLKASKSRRVTYRKPKPNEIVIDGNGDEWNNNNLTSVTTEADTQMSFYVTEDDDNVLMMIKAKDIGAHTQIFIDTDNNLLSGYKAHQRHQIMGADILIEDDIASYFTGKDYEWSWTQAPAITVARSNEVIEVSISKSILKNKSKRQLYGLEFGFRSLDANWNARANNQGIPLMTDNRFSPRK